MAEVETNFIIPQFKEKVIYYTSNNLEFSYPVSASYKGILRLSPNDDGTLQERNSVELYTEKDTLDIYYTDSLENIYDSQLIKASTSDGYLIDWRIDKFRTEFDNLYVIGPCFQGKLKVYNTKDEAIIYDSVNYFPSSVNNNYGAIREDTDFIEKDVIEVDIHNNIDATSALVSKQTTSRKFEYTQIVSLAKDMIMEALMSLETMPTGSIHHTPINVKEYMELVKEGVPNQYFTRTGADKNDPIVRDYLICDGSLYNNEDFPELAKILYGELIEYWVYDAEQDLMVKKRHVNGEDGTTTFRVPDLRRMFIKSVYLDIEKINDAKNRTGIYNVDNRPILPDGKLADNHRHWSTTAYYPWIGEQQFGVIPPFLDGNLLATTFQSVSTKNSETGTLGLSSKPAILAPKNNMAEFARGQYGMWYNVSHYSGECAKYWIPINPCGYFLSVPQEFDYQNPTITANVGMSSENIVSAVEPTNDEDISYNDKDEYVAYIDGELGELYGMENAPEFVCMLPLIRI